MLKSPLTVAKNSAGIMLKDHEALIDLGKMRRYRLDRVRAEMRTNDIGACVLFNPFNIRYATGTRNLAVFSAHNHGRYIFLPAEGPVILFETWFAPDSKLHLDVIDDVRPANRWTFYSQGSRFIEHASKWADEVADLVHRHCEKNARVAIDTMAPAGYEALRLKGIACVEAQGIMEMARVIKSPEEIACISISLSVCEAGLDAMRSAIRPGVTENMLWSIFVGKAFSLGAESVETRLMASGGRTYPWYQECGDRLLRPQDLVAIDSDLIGPFGYCADLSRTFFCGPGKPSEQQKQMYRLALEEITHNTAVLKTGMSFREFGELAFAVPEKYFPNHYTPIHGVGLTDEYPCLYHMSDWDAWGYDGTLAEGMTLCVESYIGSPDAAEGVKLEQQVLLTDEGAIPLTTFPFDDDFLAG